MSDANNNRLAKLIAKRLACMNGCNGVDIMVIDDRVGQDNCDALELLLGIALDDSKWVDFEEDHLGRLRRKGGGAR